MRNTFQKNVETKGNHNPSKGSQNKVYSQPIFFIDTPNTYENKALLTLHLCEGFFYLKKSQQLYKKIIIFVVLIKHMKKLVIISLMLSLITIGILFWMGVIELHSSNLANWMVLPYFYIVLSLGYWWFGGMFGILTGLFDPTPKEKTGEEPNEFESNDYNSYVSKSKKKDDESSNFVTSATIGYITDNPLIGGAIGGSFSGGLLGSSLDGDLFN